MKKQAAERNSADDMRAEYDFTGGVRGKYAAQFRAGTNLVLLEPDVADAFPDAESVNAALRSLIEIAKRARKPKRAS